MTQFHCPLHDANNDGVSKAGSAVRANGKVVTEDGKPRTVVRRKRRNEASFSKILGGVAPTAMLLLLVSAVSSSPAFFTQAFLFPRSSYSNVPFSPPASQEQRQQLQRLVQTSPIRNAPFQSIHPMSSSSSLSISEDDDATTGDIIAFGSDDGYDGLGEYDPSEDIRPEREVVVGDPQIRLKEKERSVTSILKELAAIQQQGPQKYCILGTRHCSYLHQQIIELLAYALVLSGNHVYTSGAGGTHAATIRGALRAEREDLLTVVLPQSMNRQAKESQELLLKVKDVITMPQNDDKGLDVASRICNSYLLSQTDQLISFAFHESNTVIEATKEAKKLDMLVTVLYLD